MLIPGRGHGKDQLGRGWGSVEGDKARRTRGECHEGEFEKNKKERDEKEKEKKKKKEGWEEKFLCLNIKEGLNQTSISVVHSSTYSQV